MAERQSRGGFADTSFLLGDRNDVHVRGLSAFCGKLAFLGILGLKPLNF